MVCNSGGVSEKKLDIFFYFENMNYKIKKKKNTVDVYKLTNNPSVQENSNARTLPVH